MICFLAIFCSKHLFSIYNRSFCGRIFTLPVASNWSILTDGQDLDQLQGLVTKYSPLPVPRPALLTRHEKLVSWTWQLEREASPLHKLFKLLSYHGPEKGEIIELNSFIYESTFHQENVLVLVFLWCLVVNLLV